MLIPRFWRVQRPGSPAPICRTWSSKHSHSAMGDHLDETWLSLAAIQASKEKATEVELKHFEWAQVGVLPLLRFDHNP